MKWVLLMLFTYALSKSYKEEACLMISDYSKIYKKAELNEFLQNNQWANKKQVMKKMAEDMFYYCLARIEEKEAVGINNERMPDYKKVQHLLGVELEYKSEKDLELSQEYTDIHKRLKKVWIERFTGRDL